MNAAGIQDLAMQVAVYGLILYAVITLVEIISILAERYRRRQTEKLWVLMLRMIELGHDPRDHLPNLSPIVADTVGKLIKEHKEKQLWLDAHNTYHKALGHKKSTDKG